MPGYGLTHHGKTAMEMFNKAVEAHKAHYGSLPYRVVLGIDWKDEMQDATAFTVEGKEVLVSYRKNQHWTTISTDSEKHNNGRNKQA